jgi:hypothetical protein
MLGTCCVPFKKRKPNLYTGSANRLALSIQDAIQCPNNSAESLLSSACSSPGRILGEQISTSFFIGFVYPVNLISVHTGLWGKGRPAARKADNLTAICEPIA